MAKKNTFYGATVTAATISTYYKNTNFPDFDHFTFQQQLDDGTKPDDDFTLTVFAIDKYGVVLNAGTPLPITPVNSNGFTPKNNVQFANLKLDLTGLATLYPKDIKCDLSVSPHAFYKATGYVIYMCVTESPFHPNTPIKVPIDPSPPA
jgi:hypothetical protein